MALARINSKLIGLTDVYRGDTSSAMSLPEQVLPVWTSSLIALDSAANFLSLLSEHGTVAKVVHAAWLLQTSSTALCDSFSFVMAQTSVNKEPLSSPRAEAVTQPVRALCPHCRELYEWAPAQYGGILRMIAASRLGQLKLRCARASEEIRKHVALQRRRLRKFVDDELEILFDEIVSGRSHHSPSSSSAASRAARPIDGSNGPLPPNQVLETLKLRTLELKSRRRRTQQREELLAMRKTIADELMEAAETHLEEVWQERMKDVLLNNHPLQALSGCSSPKAGGIGTRSPESHLQSSSIADDQQLEVDSVEDTGGSSASMPVQFRLDADDPAAEQESCENTTDNVEEAIRHYELADVIGITSESGQ